MVRRAIRLVEGSIYRVQQRVSDQFWASPHCKLDEEQGQFVARDIRERYRKSRQEATMIEHELQRLSDRLLSRFTSKQRRSDLETRLREVLEREEMNMEGWYCISLDTKSLSGDKYASGFHVYVKPSVFEKAQTLQREEPIYLGTYSGGKFWWHRDKFWVSTMYSEEEARLLLWEKGRREQRKFERLAKAMAAAKEARGEARRERIPEEVRLLVWERDGGRCVKCGSTEDLEFDHIIPVSKGGSNTEKNVQLLCARCNREKGNRIA